MYKIADNIMGYMKFKGKLESIKELIDYPDPKVGDILYVKEHSANYTYTMESKWVLLDSARVQEYTQLETILNPQNLQRCYVIKDNKIYIYFNDVWRLQSDFMNEKESIFDDTYLFINYIDVLKWIDNIATHNQKVSLAQYIKIDLGEEEVMELDTVKGYRLDTEGRIKE